MKFTTAVFCAVAMSMLGMTAHAGGPENLWENTCRLNAAGKGSKYACFESQDGPLIYQAGSTENDYYLPGADDDNHWAVVLGKEHHQFGEFQFATKGWGVHVKNSKIPGCVNYQLTRVFGDDNVVLNKKWCRGERDAVIPDSQPSSGPEDFYNNFCEKGLAPRDTKLACFVSNDGPVVQGAGSTKDDYRFDSPDTHDKWAVVLGMESHKYGFYTFSTKNFIGQVSNYDDYGCVKYTLTRKGHKVGPAKEHCDHTDPIQVPAILY